METNRLAREMLKEFGKEARGNKTANAILSKAENGKGTQLDAFKYSTSIGNILADVVKRYIKASNLEDGFLDFDKAMATIYPLIENAHGMVGDVFKSIQEAIDRANGMHLTASVADLDKEKAKDLMLKMAQVFETDKEEFERLVNGTIPNIVESFYDDDLDLNAEERAQLGLTTYIIRDGSNCCPWCDELTGKYRYGEEPVDIYRRHLNCNCTVTYVSEKGYQDVWSKRLYASRREARRETIQRSLQATK